MPTFEAWYANLLGQRDFEVRRLLKDPAAIRFLIAWSMFEGRCFDDSANEKQIANLAERIVREGFDPEHLSDALIHFHARYQDKTRLRALLHKRKSERLAKVLSLPIAELSPTDRPFLVLFVVFRFRNNIFHGSKGVESWLQYGEEIRLCTDAMQAVISHVERFKQKIAA